MPASDESTFVNVGLNDELGAGDSPSGRRRPGRSWDSLPPVPAVVGHVVRR
ncbi:MAG: hypothetical protein MZV70_05635 [Desulfobacterales bacterium]|nr:hypothetical protein [Desulfobacterales bacterium]